MTSETLILTHLMKFSAQSAGQIANAIGRSASTVRISLMAMATTGDVWHDADMRYYAAEPEGDRDEKYVVLCDKAIALQDRNLWYRAARVWLEAHDATNRPGLRLKAIVSRAKCIDAGNRLAPKPELDFPLKGKSRR